MKQTKKTIIYDDTCPMCIAVVSGVDGSAKGDGFVLEGTTKAKLPKGITREQAQKEMHVIDEQGNIHRNVDAMLQIVEEYPRWRFVANIARWPVVYQILQLLYKAIAANRHFIFGPASRIYWLKNVVLLGMIAGMLLSAPLWVGVSSFPAAPSLSFLPQLPQWLNGMLFVLLLSALVGALVSPRPKPWIFGAIGLTATLVVFDQMRLQPWAYQYLWMLGMIGLYSWGVTQKNNRDFVLQALRIIVAAIYFFSGLQKINPDFITSVFPWMIEPITVVVPNAANAIESFGALVPFIEIAIGLGLFVPRLRKVAVIFAALMAAGILLLLGPFGHGWNSVVWPWNVVMPLSTALLFWHTEKITFKDVLRVRGFGVYEVVTVVFIFLPLLSFYGKWDSYLSWTLYSGNTAKAKIIFDEQTAKLLPRDIDKYAKYTESGAQLSLIDWSIGELNVPPYPEARVFKAIGADLCSIVSNSNGLTLVVTEKPTQLRQKQQTYHCSDL